VTALLDIAIDQIRVEDNPRTTFNKKGESFDSLVDSVRKLGIITPITVEAAESGFKLIAGQRRLAAAKKVGLDSIPALVRDANGSAGTIAVSENLHREALTPMEEANAFKKARETLTVEQIADGYSVSADLVRARLRLLNLPEQLQKGVDSGEVPLGSADFLAAVAEKAPAVAEAIAKAVASKESDITLSQLQGNTANAIRDAIDFAEVPGALAFNARTHNLRIDDLPGFTDEQRVEIDGLYEQKPEYQYTGPILKDEDVDAARAYGCLLEVTDSFGRTTSLVTDKDWLYDVLIRNLTALAEAGAQEKEERAKNKRTSTGSPAQLPGETDDAAKARRAEERAVQKQERIAALHRNWELGDDLQVKAKETAVDQNLLVVLGDLVVDAYGAGLLMRGLRYTHQSLSTIEPPKKEGGLPKVTMISTDEQASDKVNELWGKAKTEGQIAGFLTQLLVAAAYADQRATSQSDRKSQPIPWLGSFGDGISTPTNSKARGRRSLEQIASKLLPRSVKSAYKQATDSSQKADS